MSATLEDIEAEIARRQGATQPTVAAAPPVEQQALPELTALVPRETAPETGGIRESINQAIPAPVAEFAAAVNRGTLNLADFFTVDVLNDALAVAGSERRVPTLTETASAATAGDFMEEGLAKEAIRTGGEFVAPTGLVGSGIRAAAQAIPKVAAAAPTVAQRVVQAAASPAIPELATGAIAGAGTEVGAVTGGAIGEAIGGEEGRARGEQIGRLAGGVLVPVGAVVAKETGKTLISKSAKKLLSEAAPTIEGLKKAARSVYDDLDSLGVTINSRTTGRLSSQLEEIVRKQGFNRTIHPKVNAALKEFDAVAGKEQSLSSIDVLRRVAKSASQSNEPSEAELGRLMVSKIDDTLDNLNKANFSSAYNKEVGAKYRDARQLWRRSKKSEDIQEAWNNAELSPAGFENGIRQQFRSILKSKKKRTGFTKDELKAMKGVVDGTTLRNLSEKLGMLGIDERRVSGALMPLMGAAAGATATGGGVGAIVVPIIGTVSKKLGLKLAKDAGRGADIIVRAGNRGIDVVKAYMKAIPPKERSAQELTELLLRPEISLEGLKSASRGATSKNKQIINDAVFLTTAIKATQQEQQ